MEPHLKLAIEEQTKILREISDRLDAQEARWRGRESTVAQNSASIHDLEVAVATAPSAALRAEFDAQVTATYEQLDALEAAAATRVGALEYCAAPSIVADNWGGLFDGDDAAANAERLDSDANKLRQYALLDAVHADALEGRSSLSDTETTVGNRGRNFPESVVADLAADHLFGGAFGLDNLTPMAAQASSAEEALQPQTEVVESSESEPAACEKRLTAGLEGTPAKCSVKCPNVFGGFTATATADNEPVFDAGPIFDEARVFDAEPIFDEEPNDPITEYVDVSCLDNSSVQGLQLERLDLAGSAPDLVALVVLPGLRTLSISDDALTGAFPNVSALAVLRMFYLSRNRLSGAIPKGTFGPIRGLCKLHLSSKSSSPVPKSISSPRLLELSLANNRFEGPLPDDASATHDDDLNGQLRRLHDNVRAAHEVFEVLHLSFPAVWVKVGKFSTTLCCKSPWPPPILLESLQRGTVERAFKSIQLVILISKFHLLMPFRPACIILHFTTRRHGLVFLFSMLGITPLTGQLAVYTGPIVGGLLNATVGNATEMIIAIYAFKNGIIRVVRQSLLGTMLSNMLLVMGCAFFAGGIVHHNKDQAFSLSNTKKLLEYLRTERMELIVEVPLLRHREPRTIVGGTLYCILLVRTVRLQGYNDFSQKLKHIARLPFATIAGGTALMFLIMVWQPLLPLLSVSLLLRIAMVVEVTGARCFMGLSLWHIHKYTSLDGQPDFLRSLYSALQPATTLEDRRYHDARLSDQQRALLQYNWENIHYLSEETLRLQVCLSKYKRTTGTTPQIDLAHLSDPALTTAKLERALLVNQGHYLFQKLPWQPPNQEEVHQQQCTFPWNPGASRFYIGLGASRSLRRGEC